MSIDSRLLDSACQANIDENFDRTLAIVDAGGGLPEIAAGDAGKVLTVNDDADGVEWASGGGGGAGVLVVTYDEATQSFDKTAGEIFAAIKSGGAVYREAVNTGGVLSSEDFYPFAYASWTLEDGYMFAVLTDLDSGVYLYFNASTENDYPTMSDPDE